MAQVKKFVFNSFYENTYVVWDETHECVIVDPGCSNEHEENELEDFIIRHELKPVRLLLTHCHIDHILGNIFVSEKWQLGLEYHQKELPVITEAPQYASFFGVNCPPQPAAKRFIETGEEVRFGKTVFEVRFTPGHSPGSVSFHCAASGFILGGDVLFDGSIGRFDLPGADGNVLMSSIETQLLSLPDDTVVHAGHGEDTTIGRERMSNPYIQHWLRHHRI